MVSGGDKHLSTPGSNPLTVALLELGRFLLELCQLLTHLPWVLLELTPANREANYNLKHRPGITPQH